MSTKKSYVELVTFLRANKDKKISEILSTDEFVSLIESKKVQEVTRYNDKDVLTHIYCYYHKEWESITECEYGNKASTAWGLNTMCKIGVNQWTKQQSVAKDAKTGLLNEVAEGKLLPADIGARITEIDEAKDKIKSRAESLKEIAAKEAAKKKDE